MITNKDKQNLKFVKFEKKLITKKYIGWLNDKSLMKYSRHNKTYFDKKKCMEYLELNLLNKNLFYAILLKNKKIYVHIGNILATIDHKNKRADISILIGDKDFTNKKLGTYVWKKFIKKIIKLNRFNLITAGTKETNFKMVKIFKSSKMKLLKIPDYYVDNRKKFLK